MGLPANENPAPAMRASTDCQPNQPATRWRSHPGRAQFCDKCRSSKQRKSTNACRMWLPQPAVQPALTPVPLAARKSCNYRITRQNPAAYSKMAPNEAKSAGCTARSEAAGRIAQSREIEQWSLPNTIHRKVFPPLGRHGPLALFELGFLDGLDGVHPLESLQRRGVRTLLPSMVDAFVNPLPLMSLRRLHLPRLVGHRFIPASMFRRCPLVATETNR